MKTIIKSFLLGFITLMGCSCETADIEENRTHNYVVVDQPVSVYFPCDINDVLESIKGTYVSEEKHEVVITPEVITIIHAQVNEIIFVDESEMAGSTNCFIEVYLPDGTVIKLVMAWYPPDPGQPAVRNMLFIKLNGTYINETFYRQEAN